MSSEMVSSGSFLHTMHGVQLGGYHCWRGGSEDATQTRTCNDAQRMRALDEMAGKVRSELPRGQKQRCAERSTC